MTFTSLAYKNAWRKPGRTILLIISVTIAFIIFVVLQSFLEGASGAGTKDLDRLVVINQASAGQGLPIRYLDQLDDVAQVAFTARMRGYVETENNVIVIPQKGLSTHF